MKMRETFGRRLREQREQRNLSLADVAEQTKIKMSLLAGVERDDISQWPPGIFRRAYVRAYARAIGFDADAAVREFLELYPEPIEPTEPPSPSRLRRLIGSAFGSLRQALPADMPPTTVTGTSGTAPLSADAADPPSAAASPAPPPPVTAGASSAAPAPAPAPDLLAAAKICTELGRVEDSGQIQPLLRDTAKLLGARGVIVWLWDAATEQLRPALVHGYPSKVRSRLRGVRADADNVTAAAFRSAEVRTAAGSGGASAALAAPLLTPSGCAGVLAIELPTGREQGRTVRAIAMFVAAMLAQLLGTPAPVVQLADTQGPRALEAQPG
jgi:transcriptional regulator with XRE-family HTH domain